MLGFTVLVEFCKEPIYTVQAEYPYIGVIRKTVINYLDIQLIDDFFEAIGRVGKGFLFFVG